MEESQTTRDIDMRTPACANALGSLTYKVRNRAYCYGSEAEMNGGAKSNCGRVVQELEVTSDVRPHLLHLCSEQINIVFVHTPSRDRTNIIVDLLTSSS